MASKKNNHSPIDSLSMFAILYCHVRYFSANPSAVNCNWEKFLLKNISNFCQRHSEKNLIEKLKTTFSELTNLIFFENSSIPSATERIEIEANKKQFWQHTGICLQEDDDCYRSELISFDKWVSLQKEPQINAEWITIELNKNWSVSFPLYGDKTSEIKPLDWQEQNTSLSSDRILLLSNTILSWSILYHFYPHPELSDIREYTTLKNALNMAFDGNPQCLNYLTQMLNDGHAVVIQSDDYERAPVPFDWEIIEGKVVITQDTTSFYRGDIIEAVNRQSMQALTTDFLFMFSGRSQFRQYLASREALAAHIRLDQTVSVNRNGTIITIPVEQSLFDEKRPEGLKVIFDNIAYFDLTKNSVESLLPNITELNSYAGIIFDLRGYPIDAHAILPHLMSTPDEHEAWMQIPIITQPNQPSHVFEPHGWLLQPEKPKLSIKVCFLTNVKAVSYSESVLALVKYYQLGTVIGEYTAGANGNVNVIPLLKEGALHFTGMKVSLLDGTAMHNQGIQPDIPIKQTYQQLIHNKYDASILAAVKQIKTGNGH